jgi:choline dehydrogenase-like flavoprotein
MIESSSNFAPGDVLTADVVVVGAGAAGIPLALQLADSGLYVILLEAGAESLDARDQELYSGTVVDPKLHAPADKYRQRCLGGSTVTWGGRCVPLDPVDFLKREFVPLSGWPISNDEIAPYYPPANDWLEAGDFAYRDEDAFPDSTPPMINGFKSELIRTDGLERFSRPTNMYQRYKDRMSVSQNLRVIHEANCIGISLKETATAVKSLAVRTHGGTDFTIRCRSYVLAVGGIETARLLLASNDVQTDGIGNKHDLVGRYYMCHIAGNVGKLTFDLPKTDVRHGYEISPDGVYCRRRISFTQEEQLRQSVNNVVLRLHFPRIADPVHKSGVLSFIYLMKPFISYEYATRLRDGDGDTFKSILLHIRNVILSPLETARFGFRWIAKRNLATRKFPSIILENKSNIFSLEVHGEQCPREDSRIYLSDERDSLGMPKVVIDWKYSSQDIESVRATLTTFDKELRRTGTGKLEFNDETLESDLLRFGAYGGHHIGTTRMGTDPTTSVVDSDCRVHDVDNLFIASSAVFPTSGQANPTLAITALALRLADHIAGNLRQPAHDLKAAS